MVLVLHCFKVKNKYGLPLQKALRATLRREILLVQRNHFVYVFRCVNWPVSQ